MEMLKTSILAWKNRPNISPIKPWTCFLWESAINSKKDKTRYQLHEKIRTLHTSFHAVSTRDVKPGVLKKRVFVKWVGPYVLQKRQLNDLVG